MQALRFQAFLSRVAGLPSNFNGKKVLQMRSRKVFGALHSLQNRYILCQLASKATRKFHRPNTRIQETMNEVLELIASEQLPVIKDTEGKDIVEERRRAA